MARSSLEIRFVTRLTEAQAKQVAEYAARHGHHTKAAAIRALVVKGVRYDRWQEGRRVRNLPPFPSSRILKIEPPGPARAAELVDHFRGKYPGLDDDGVAKMITGSAVAFKPLRRKVANLIRRGKREREHAKLEEDMNRDLQSRRSAGGGG